MFPTYASSKIASSNFLKKGLIPISKISVIPAFSKLKLFPLSVPLHIPIILYFSIYLNFFSYFYTDSCYLLSVSKISSSYKNFFNTIDPEEPILLSNKNIINFII